MALDPQVEAIRSRRLAEGTPPLYSLSLEQARAADLAAIQSAGGSPEPVDVITEDHIPGPKGPLPIRVYRPESDVPLPVLLYFFGGGWTLGTIDTCDGICRRIANAVPCATIAAGYRLAPEHKFPAALHDCYAALTWAAGRAESFGGDGRRLAVGGDSAGGNLAAAVCLYSRDHGGVRPAAQLLVYPNTDYLADTPSRRENLDEAFFNDRSVTWYWDHYLADPADGASPYASPLRADDLSGLPPALIITAEFDPLRDEGEQYARRLADSGVPVHLSRYDGMIHGFFAMPGVLDAGKRASAEAAAFLRDRFAD